jgi:hypothetical protein
MACERSSGGSFVIFVFPLLSCSCVTQMNECFVKSKYDHLLFTFLYVFVSPTERCNLENFRGALSVIVLMEYLELYQEVQQVDLHPELPNEHIW